MLDRLFDIMRGCEHVALVGAGDQNLWIDGCSTNSEQ